LRWVSAKRRPIRGSFVARLSWSENNPTSKLPVRLGRVTTGSLRTTYSDLNAVGIGEAPAYTRVVRGSTLVVREQSYIEAARAIGTRDYRIIKDYVFPNVIQALIVIATVGFAVAIVIGSSLGFLGLGAQPPAAEWGTMVSDGRNYLRTEWWISAFPGATIGMVVLAINVLGDALRDILDPRLR